MNYLVNRRKPFTSSSPLNGEGWKTNLSTATAGSILATGLSDADQIQFSPDGLYLYIANVSAGLIRQYTLSSAFDITTAGEAYDFSSSYRSGFAFSYDGIYFFTANNSQKIQRHVCSTAYDLKSISGSSLVNTYSTGIPSYNLYGMSMSPDCRRLFFTTSYFNVFSITGSDSNVFSSSTLDADTVSWKAASGNTSSPTWSSLFIAPNGHDLFVMDVSSRYIFRFYLPSAWSLSGAYYVGQNFNSGNYDSVPTGMCFNNNGKKMFIIGTGSKVVYSFDLTES